jgi:hypothetical protein
MANMEITLNISFQAQQHNFHKFPVFYNLLGGQVNKYYVNTVQCVVYKCSVTQLDIWQKFKIS